MTKPSLPGLVATIAAGAILALPSRPAGSAPLPPAPPQHSAGLSPSSPLVQDFNALPQNLYVQRAVINTAVRPGEIRLDGWVRAINPKTGRLDLQVTGFLLPNGHSRLLRVARPKTVAISNQTVIGTQGVEASVGILARIPIGVRVAVIGRDLGTGSILPARAVVRLVGRP